MFLPLRGISQAGRGKSHNPLVILLSEPTATGGSCVARRQLHRKTRSAHVPREYLARIRLVSHSCELGCATGSTLQHHTDQHSPRTQRCAYYPSAMRSVKRKLPTLSGFFFARVRSSANLTQLGLGERARGLASGPRSVPRFGGHEQHVVARHSRLSRGARRRKLICQRRLRAI